MADGTVMSLPFELRANDIQKHLISIDSRFRQNPTSTSSSDYYVRLHTPIKNVLRIRMTSFEFPNNYPFFHSGRKNVTVRILYMSGVTGGTVRTAIITIPDGNYSAADLQGVLISECQKLGLTWMTITFNFATGGFAFRGNRYFGIDTMYDSIDRPFDYGLGYYLGFMRNFYKSKISVEADTSGQYILNADFCASFDGDNYIFVKINDYDCVRHYTDTTSIHAFAKIILREGKSNMAFDDYASDIAKEIVFKSPQNISRLHVQILDLYGESIELVGTNHSFTLEVLEIQNMTLYNSIRESLALTYS
jgi:hypothetical protein